MSTEFFCDHCRRYKKMEFLVRTAQTSNKHTHRMCRSCHERVAEAVKSENEDPSGYKKAKKAQQKRADAGYRNGKAFSHRMYREV